MSALLEPATIPTKRSTFSGIIRVPVLVLPSPQRLQASVGISVQVSLFLTPQLAHIPWLRLVAPVVDLVRTRSRSPIASRPALQPHLQVRTSPLPVAATL